MNPVNVCSTGNLVQEISRSGFAIFLGPDLEPGDGRRGEVVIANLGVLPVAIELSELDPSNECARGRVVLAIDEITGARRRRVFLGEIGGVPAGGIDLGLFEAGESRTYRFTALLRKGTSEAERGPVSAAYRWNAMPALSLNGTNGA